MDYFSPGVVMPIGKKFGGRKKGTPNKVTIQHAEKIAESGLTPLDFMLLELRDESNDKAFRADMARSAAPYVHPKLAAIEHSGKGGGPIMVSLDNADAKA